MKNIDQQEFVELSKEKDYIVLDVRTPEECASGIIPGATPIDIMNQTLFMSEIMKLDKSKSYLVYCRSGNRSSQACQSLDELGISTSFNLTGGMLAWTGKTVIPA